MMVNFYAVIIEHILTSSITVWFGAAAAKDKTKLQHVIYSVERVIGCNFSPLQELYSFRSRKSATRINFYLNCILS